MEGRKEGRDGGREGGKEGWVDTGNMHKLACYVGILNLLPPLNLTIALWVA